MWNELNHQDSQEFFTFLISQLEEEVGMKSKFLPGLNYNDFVKIIIFPANQNNYVNMKSLTMRSSESTKVTWVKPLSIAKRKPTFRAAAGPEFDSRVNTTLSALIFSSLGFSSSK